MMSNFFARKARGSVSMLDMLILQVFVGNAWFHPGHIYQWTLEVIRADHGHRNSRQVMDWCELGSTLMWCTTVQWSKMV